MSNRLLPHGLPRTPVDLLAVAVSGCQVILAWSEVGSGGLGFRIERATGSDPGRPFLKIGRVGPRVTAFRDGSVKPRVAYTYRIRAWNASGDSPPSIVVEVSTPQAEVDGDYHEGAGRE